MPIIFENHRRKRLRRRVATGAAVVAAGTIGVIAGTSIGTHDAASPAQEPAIEASAASEAKPVAPTQQANQPARQSSSLSDGAANEPPSSPECYVVDGDTLRCGHERIRLLGVDAPELPGHCRPGRHCVQGDPFAATDALKKAITGHKLRISGVGFDSYDRTLANVYVDGRNVSCSLIAHGFVKYVERWDNDRLVAKDCPELSL